MPPAPISLMDNTTVPYFALLLECGEEHACVILETGDMKCWGVLVRPVPFCHSLTRFLHRFESIRTNWLRNVAKLWFVFWRSTRDDAFSPISQVTLPGPCHLQRSTLGCTRQRMSRRDGATRAQSLWMAQFAAGVSNRAFARVLLKLKSVRLWRLWPAGQWRQRQLWRSPRIHASTTSTFCVLSCYGTSHHSKMQVKLPGTVRKVSSGESFNCALLQSGHISCWGASSVVLCPSSLLKVILF